MSDRVIVRSEPRTYCAGGPNSYFKDLAHVEVFGGVGGVSAATERLRAHAKEVEVEIKEGSAEGRRAAKVVQEVRRSSDAGAELRAGITTGSSSAGAFVTPDYLTQLWAAFRTADRSFVNQCRALPLPAYGMTFHVPSFTSSTTTTSQTELQGVTEGDPSGADEPVTVTTQTGQVELSYQLLERGGFDGNDGGFDEIVIAQLGNQLDSQIDTYALSTALATAGSVPDAAAYSTTNFFGDMSTAREILTDTAGTRLYPTHLFTTSDLAGFITKQVDSQNRPIFLPDAGALIKVDGDPEWLGWLGIALPGRVQWFADDNIPASGANTQLIVCRPQEVFVWEGDAMSFVAPKANPGATSLSAVVGLRKYLAVLPRYAKAVVTITGNAYPTSAK